MLTLMSQTYLILDTRRLLDSSEVGKSAAKKLEQKFVDGKSRFEEMLQRAKRATGLEQKKLQQEAKRFETESLQALEQDRSKLRQSLMERAAPVLERLSAERGASLVLDRSAVVFFQAELDVTDIVMQEVDAAGPLS